MDQGPNRFNVIDRNGGTWVPDQNLRAHSALSFDGVSQCIVIPYDSRLLPDELTWSGWVNFQNFNFAQLWTMGGGAGGGGGGLQLQDAGLNYADFTPSGYDANFTVDWTNFQANTWCQIVVSRSSNSCAMFANGLKVGSQTGLTPYTKSQASDWVFAANIGLDQSLYQMFCPLALNRIHTYNRALSDSEVVFLYTNEAAGIVPTATITVKTIRVNLNQLVLGQTYQLQSSPDFLNWTNYGGAFPATNSATFQDVDILGTSMGYFRVVELP